MIMQSLSTVTHLSPAQDPLNLSHKMIITYSIYLKQHFYISCEINLQVCFSCQGSFTCDHNPTIRTDTWLTSRELAFPILLSPVHSHTAEESLRQYLGLDSKCETGRLNLSSNSYLVTMDTIRTCMQELPNSICKAIALNNLMLEKSSAQYLTHFKLQHIPNLFVNIRPHGKKKVTKLKKEVDCFSWNFCLINSSSFKTCYTNSLSKKFLLWNLSNHVPIPGHSCIREAGNSPLIWNICTWLQNFLIA